MGLDVLRKSSFTIDYRNKEMLFGPVEALTFSAPFDTDTPVVTIRMRFQNQKATPGGRHRRSGPDAVPKSSARFHRFADARDRKGVRRQWNISAQEGADSRGVSRQRNNRRAESHLSWMTGKMTGTILTVFWV